MDRLISLQAAIDVICKACANGDDYVECVERRPESTFCDEIVALRKLPSAQPEIIRCKNCTWWSDDEYRECSSPNYDNVHVTPAGFYCGYAERRTDEHEK